MIKILRLIKEMLSEVGDSRDPYEYKEKDRHIYKLPKKNDSDSEVKDDPKALVTPTSEAKYSFQTKNGDIYNVRLVNLNYFLSVSFITEGSGYDTTNKGEPFKIMATVSSIIAKELNLDVNAKIKGVSYYPVTKTGEKSSKVVDPNKRDKLYRLFIKSISPTAVFRSKEGKIYAFISERPVKTEKIQSNS